MDQMIGRYQLRGVLGTGGFATVYEAYDEGLDQTVAIKVLAENHALNPDVRERFVREAQAIRKVEDASVIRVHDIGETSSGQPYLVTELLQGGDLANRLADLTAAGSNVSPNQLREVIGFLTAAMSAVHGCGLVHRDIAPANILLRTPLDADNAGLGMAESFVLGDFGLVKDLAAASGITVGAGTQGFGAPEQRTAQSMVDHRADIYGASAVVAAVANQADPTAPWLLQLQDALAVGMSEDATDRPANAAAWNKTLLTAFDEPPKETSSATSPRLWIAVAGVLTLVLIGFLAWGISRGGSSVDDSGLLSASSSATVVAANNTVIFDDVLAPGWSNQSWGVTNFQVAMASQRGAGISAELDGFGAVSLVSDTVVDSPGWVTFWVKTTSASPALAIRLNGADGEAGEPCLLTANDVVDGTQIDGTWSQVQFALDRFPTSSSQLTRVSIIDRSGLPQTLELDQVQLVAAPAVPPGANAGCDT